MSIKQNFNLETLTFLLSDPQDKRRVLGHLHRLRGQLAQRAQRELPQELRREVRRHHPPRHQQVRTASSEDGRGRDVKQLLTE